MNKIILIVLFSFILLVSILIIDIVSAEFWACFQKGEVIHYCNSYKPDKICDHFPICSKCMSVYKEAENCYIHGVYPKCLYLPPECSNQNDGVVVIPLNFTVSLPENDFVYNSRSVPFTLESNKMASYYYIDAINGRGIWKRLCSRCTSFNRGVNFQDGQNKIIIKAVADNAEEVDYTREFYVDSKKPRIKRIEPRSGFMGSIFTVNYDEDNIKEVKLEYGNYATGYKTETLNCPEGKNQECDIEVNLEDYDGQQIEYWFSITDIADNYVESRHVKVDVDTTYPKMDLNWKKEGRSVYFNISVDEENFDSVDYTDWSESRPRWRTLCSRLKNGICERRISFRYGYHELSTQATDKAGNAVSQNVEFTI